MNEPSSVSQSLQSLLTEAFQGGKAGESWFLNPGDPGLVPLCRSLSAKEVSTPPGAGRKTIAAHVRHVVYHLELIERLLKGEQNVFETSDWSEAWKHTTVDDRQWSGLCDRLESLSQKWIQASASVPLEPQVMLTGSLASSAHFAYHLGAIRQILLQVRDQSDRA